MNEIRQQVESLERKHHRKAPLWDLLHEELDWDFDGDPPTNLSKELLKACYSRIAPGEDPHDRLARCHDNYSAKWVEDNTEQAVMATALKLLLHERVGRSKGNVVSGDTIQTLSEIIVAIRTSSEEYSDQWLTEEDGPNRLEAAPERSPPPESCFDDGLPFEDALTSKLCDWVRERRSESDGHHAVYVLDCTPGIGEEEHSKIRSLRSEVASSGVVTSGVERAAQALNTDERVFYVGYAADICERMDRHNKLPSGGGSKFTASYKPNELVEISFYDTKKEAQKREGERAHELTKPGTSYAFSEQKNGF